MSVNGRRIRRRPPGGDNNTRSRCRHSKKSTPKKRYHSKYDPSFCDKVIQLMANGASKKELALELGVIPWTIWDWEKRHPEFHQAIKIGEMLSEAWWMREGRMNIHNKDFNAVLYMMQMSNRFGWTRRWDINAKTEHHEKRTLEVKFDMSKLSTQTVRELLNAMGQNLLPDWKERESGGAESTEIIDVTAEVVH